MTPERRITFVVPDDIDNPARPSGGNEYDRRLVAGLRAAGWVVDVRLTGGPRTAADAIAEVADGAVVLIDGLLVADAADALVVHAARLRLVVLMHMSMAAAPPGHASPGTAAAERAVLACAAAVVATSRWLGQQLVARHGIDPGRVSVASPGVDQAPLVPGSPSGNRLLCVAPVAGHKGHDVLVAALARLRDLDWTCRCVGSLDRDVVFASSVRVAAAQEGIGDRMFFTGARTRSKLADEYAASDLLVLPTRSESYGMVLTEALARGLPVVASEVGGVVEAATGATVEVRRPAVPGALVPADDPVALAGPLRQWLCDAGTRAEWRRLAAQRRRELPGWEATARCVLGAIERAAASPPG